MKYFILLLISVIYADSYAEPSASGDYKLDLLFSEVQDPMQGAAIYGNDTKIAYIPFLRDSILAYRSIEKGSVSDFYKFPAFIRKFCVHEEEAFIFNESIFLQVNLETKETIRELEVPFLFIEGEKKHFYAREILISPKRQRLYLLGGVPLQEQGAPNKFILRLFMYDLVNAETKLSPVQLNIDTISQYNYMILSPDEKYLVIGELGYKKSSAYGAKVYNTDDDFSLHWQFDAFDPAIKDIQLSRPAFQAVSGDLAFPVSSVPIINVFDIQNKSLKYSCETGTVGFRVIASSNTVKDLFFSVTYKGSPASLINVSDESSSVVYSDVQFDSQKISLSKDDKILFEDRFEGVNVYKISPITSVDETIRKTRLKIVGDIAYLENIQPAEYDSFSLVSIEGKHVADGSITRDGALLSLSAFPSGLYFLVLSGPAGTEAHKMLWSN